MIIVRAQGNGKAEILIYDFIGEDFFGEGVTGKRIKQELDALGEVTDIDVRINSPGGNVWDGLTIYNLLKEHAAEIHVHIDGLAASAASFIAMAGNLITMGEGTMMMIHNPWSLAIGDADDMRKAADMLDKVESQFVDIYSRRTGNKRDDIAQMMDEETWLTDAEAVAQGFADERAVEDPPEEQQEQPSDHWQQMVARFKHPPESLKGVRKLAAVAVTTKSAPSDATPGGNMSTPNASVQNTTDIENARKEAKQAALKEEKERQDGIRAAFSAFAAHAELRDSCLQDQTCTVAAAREKLLERLGETAEPISGPASVRPGVDGRDKFVAGAERALLVRVGQEKREQGNEFQGKTLWQIGAQALEMAGISTVGLTPDGIARKVLAAHTSSDFPQLLSNVAGKVLRAAYDNFPNTWQQIAAAGSVSDFKVHPRIQLGSFNNLETIPEGGEYKYGSLAEEYENAQATTKGRGIGMSRQMIVNDDLGGFNRRAQIMGRAAARSVNVDFYTFLTSGANNRGPTGADGGQYFNATAPSATGSGHGNLTTTGTAISAASIGVGRALMRKQKDKSVRETLNILPKVLLAPVGKEDLAWTVINSATDVSQANPSKKNYVADVARLDLVTDPFLDDISATAWYLFADPMDAAAGFEVVFLDGVQTPFVDDMIDFDTDTMKFKVRLDYGVAIGDWRGGYKNEGA